MMNRRNKLEIEHNEVLDNQATLQKYKDNHNKARRDMKDFVQD